jgi:hypothetical protein
MIELAASVLIATAAPDKGNNQIPPGWELPCILGFGLGVLFSQTKPGANSKSRELETSEGETTSLDSPNYPLNPEYEHYLDIGKRIIGGFAVSDRSQMIVAPSRCGKTTVMFFLLDEFFKRYPDMQCWVWQGKTIEPVHPKIERDRHTLFEAEKVDTAALDAVYEIYKQRAAGNSDRTQTKLIITDWQSIKDGLQATNFLKDVAIKIMTLANNGASLGVTVTGDTQSANIDDWGLGSGSIRDNFDIYAVSRLEWVDGYAKGDIKALPKIIGNTDIVVNSGDRKKLLEEFELLREWMEDGLVESSVLLSTVGVCQLGVTPNFERKLLQWVETVETSEKAFSETEPVLKQSFSDIPETVETTTKPGTASIVEISNDFVSTVSESFYTPLKLPKTTVLGILQNMQAEKGIGQTKIIRMLWGVSAGDSEKYRQAVSEYTKLTKE